MTIKKTITKENMNQSLSVGVSDAGGLEFKTADGQSGFIGFGFDGVYDGSVKGLDFKPYEEQYSGGIRVGFTQKELECNNRVDLIDEEGFITRIESDKIILYTYCHYGEASMIICLG